jgi:transposase InsO family protein
LAGQHLRGTVLAVSNTKKFVCTPTTRSASQGGVARCINFYNIQRPHSSLDKQTPDEF